MKKYLKISLGFILLFSVLTLIACDGLSKPKPNENKNDNNPVVDVDDEDHIIDKSEHEDIETPTEEHLFFFDSQDGDSYLYKCNHCDRVAVVKIEYKSGTKGAFDINENTITFHNITEESVYAITGDFYGNIIIDVTENYKFELKLEGLNLYSSKEAPLAILTCDKVTISAKNGTLNYIYDLRDEVTDEEISSSIYAECDLNIQGKGKLLVKSVNNNGIHTKDDLKIKNLTLQIDCMDNALKGNDNVTIESGDLVLIARQGDGIKTKNSNISSKGNQRGTIAISGGNILIYAACDGIDASYDVIIDESSDDLTLQIFTDKYSKYSKEVIKTSDGIYYIRHSSNAYKYSIKYYNDEHDVKWYNSSSSQFIQGYYYYPITKPSNYKYMQLFVYASNQTQGQDDNYLYTIDELAFNKYYDTLAVSYRNNQYAVSWTNYTTVRPGGMGGGMHEGNPDKGDYSTKGIKADNEIIIRDGNITIKSYDDAIHANSDVALENGSNPLGNITIKGGIIILESNDDGVHADNKVLIEDGTLSILKSYEGIEGSVVEIAGGNIAVYSTDDGINGTGTSGTSIIISGGYLYVYSTQGDGLDSNSMTSYGGIHFTGGYSVIISLSQRDSSIDSERGYKYSGGYIVAICQSGGMSSESTNSSPSFSTIGKSSKLNLQNGTYLNVGDLASVKINFTMNSLVIVLGENNILISTTQASNLIFDENGVYWN